MADSGTYTFDTIARRARLADSLLGNALSYEPIKSPWQGAAKMAQALLGGYLYNKDREDQSAAAQSLAALLTGGSSAAAPAAAPASAPEVTPMPQAVQADASQPRGIRNNNPLNIEAGSFTQGQPGYSGSDGRFAKFASMDQGLGAANKLLDTYQNKYGLNTPAGIIGRWAPANDGNPVSAYAGSVAKALGIGPNDPVPPDKRMALIQAMGRFENGRPIPQGPQESAPQQMAQAAQAQPQQGGDIRAKIGAMLQSGNPYIRQQAMGLARGMIGKELSAVHPVTEQEKKLYPGAVAVDSNGKPVFPPPKMDVQVNSVANPIMTGISKQFDESRDQANKAVDSINVTHELRRQLDSGMFTGPLANWQTGAVKIADAIGLPVSSDQLNKMANSETFMATAANLVKTKIKAFGSGSGITDTDRDFTNAMVGGKITLNQESMRRILDINEKLDRYSISKHNKMAKTLLDNPNSARELGPYAPLLSIQEPAQYEAPQKAPQPQNDPLGIR